MNSQQVQDMRLMYEAVYNDELWELANEYNNTVYDEDIVEVATEYFYTYGLNEDGINILIEKIGLESFVEYVYDLSEDLILTEARKVSKAKKQPGSLRSRQQEKLAAQRAASEKKEVEREEPESRDAESEAKAEQPKSKKPVRDAIARNIFRAVDAYKAGMERHKSATATAGRLASETGNTLGKIASVTREAGRRAGEHVKKRGLKSLANEEVENWVNSLIEEGYDLSDYTWDEMAEIYIDEAARRTPKKDRGSKNTKSYQDGRSQGGMMSSGDSQVSGAGYMRRGGGIQTQTDPNERQPQQGRMDRYTRDEMEYRKTNLRAGKVHKVGGPKGLPEEVDLFDTILEHLVAEGYADTNEAALAIMANMSEEWREEILDERKHPIMTVTSPTGETRSKKRPGATVDSDYHRHEKPDEIDRRRFSQQLSDAEKERKSKMDAGRLTVATKRGIEKATNRSNDGPGGGEFAPGSALRRREEDDQPTDYRARKRRASGR
jgi:hypothetical protein